jgi:hypothetical protein
MSSRSASNASTCCATGNLLLIDPPKILINSTHAKPATAGSGISTAVRLLLSDAKTISIGLVRFSRRLSTRAHLSMWAIFAAHEATLAAVTTRYVSSAYLSMELPFVTRWRSEAVTEDHES